MEKLKCKVITLPGKLKENSEWALFIIHGQPHIGTILPANYPCEHMYLTSDREIRQDDYVITRYRGKEILYQNVHGETGSVIGKREYIRKSCRRIEATTDTALGLPMIPKSFVEKYVEKRGEIKEVIVDLDSDGYQNLFKEELIAGCILKTRQNNTAIVSMLKDTYSREEVKQLFLAFTDQLGEYIITPKMAEEWLDEHMI